MPSPPREIAERVETVGVAKAQLPFASMLILAILAGAFIGLGALYFVVVRPDPSLGFALRQILGGMAFALGLILVIVAGAELFTGNNILVMAWADRKISTVKLLKSWAIVCIRNFVGALGLALLVFLSRHPDLNNGAIGLEYLKIAQAKVTMPFWTAFFRGVLCNALVCLGVWMALEAGSYFGLSNDAFWPTVAISGTQAGQKMEAVQVYYRYASDFSPCFRVPEHQ